LSVLLDIWLGAEVLVQVMPQGVRERINLTESAVSVDVVNRSLVDAAETLELEADLTIDPDVCTDGEAVAIRNLTAVYCYQIEGRACIRTLLRVEL